MAEEQPPKLSTPFETQFHKERLQEFTILKLLHQIHTADLVKVLAVYPTAGSTGFVDVQPLIQETDTRGVLIAQAPIYKVPYLRVQGGTSAIILDPVVGDLGIAIIAERDISNVVATKAEGAAATARRFNAGDALYLGGLLNADPTQWVKFDPAGGIDITSTGNLSLTAPGNMTLTTMGSLTINVTGNVNVTAAATTWNGPVTFNGAVSAPAGATIGGIPFATHRHGGVSSGSATSGTPVP
jgi:hypothetical protein